MSHVYKKNRVSRGYQPIFVAEAKLYRVTVLIIMLANDDGYPGTNRAFDTLPEMQ